MVKSTLLHIVCTVQIYEVAHCLNCFDRYCCAGVMKIYSVCKCWHQYFHGHKSSPHLLLPSIYHIVNNYSMTHNHTLYAQCSGSIMWICINTEVQTWLSVPADWYNMIKRYISLITWYLIYMEVMEILCSRKVCSDWRLAKLQNTKDQTMWAFLSHPNTQGHIFQLVLIILYI